MNNRFWSWVRVVSPDKVELIRQVPKPNGGYCNLVKEIKIHPTPMSEMYVGIKLTYSDALRLIRDDLVEIVV